jgi:hypothetical protein
MMRSGTMLALGTTLLLAATPLAKAEDTLEWKTCTRSTIRRRTPAGLLGRDRGQD